VNRRNFLKSSTMATAAAMLAMNGVQLAEAQDPQTYYMITFLSRLDYWVDAYRGMLDAAEFLGVEAVYTGTPEYDAEAQLQILEETAALNPNGILLTVMRPDVLQPAIDRTIESGIPLVTFDADAPLSKRYSFIGTGNYYSGVVAARYLGPLIESGRVIISTDPGQDNLDERVAGFKATLAAEFPNVTTDESLLVDPQGDQAIAATRLAEVLMANPDVRGMFGTNAQSAAGISFALREANLTDQVHSIGFDYDLTTLNLIDNGELGATLAQGTWQMGFWGMMFLYMVNNNLVKPVSDWQAAGISPLPPNVDTGVVVINRENSQYWRSDT
jgi:ribose transport system substrate-binding protein